MGKKSNQKKTAATNKSNHPRQKVKVLYQNIHGTWFAFTNHNENIFFGKVPTQVSVKDIPDEFKKRVDRAFRPTKEKN